MFLPFKQISIAFTGTLFILFYRFYTFMLLPIFVLILIIIIMITFVIIVFVFGITIIISSLSMLLTFIYHSILSLYIYRTFLNFKQMTWPNIVQNWK